MTFFKCLPSNVFNSFVKSWVKGQALMLESMGNFKLNQNTPPTQPRLPLHNHTSAAVCAQIWVFYPRPESWLGFSQRDCDLKEIGSMLINALAKGKNVFDCHKSWGQIYTRCQRAHKPFHCLSDVIKKTLFIQGIPSICDKIRPIQIYWIFH